MNSLTNKLSFDSDRENSQQNTDINSDCDMRSRSNSNKQRRRSTDDTFHAAFPHKQEIVEEIKPKIKINCILSLPSKKAKQEVVEEEFKPLINPIVSSNLSESIHKVDDLKKSPLNSIKNVKSPKKDAIHRHRDANLPFQDLKPVINLNPANTVPLPQKDSTAIEDLSDKDFRQFDFDVSSIPLPDETPFQNIAALFMYYYPNWRPPSPPLPEPEEAHTESCSIENYSFPPPPPKFVPKSTNQDEDESPLDSQSEQPSNKRSLSLSMHETFMSAPTPTINSQTEKRPPNGKNFQISMNEPVTSQLQTPLLPSWRRNSERTLQDKQDGMHESSDFKKPSLTVRLDNLKERIKTRVCSQTSNIKENSQSNLNNTNKNDSPSISDFIYPPKDMQEIPPKSSKNIILPPSPISPTSKTLETPKFPRLNFFNNNLNNSSFSSNSSIKSTQSSPFKKENYFNSSKNSSIGSGRFSFYTPKFNPLRYKNGWLFRHLCEKPSLKNPAIKSPMKTPNNSFNENEEEGNEKGGNDSIISENADLRPYRIVPIIFSFNLTPIAPFFTNSYCFSNHYMVDYLKIDGQFFCCTEQYYMFYKAKVFNDRKAMSDIMRTKDPKFMKRIGSQVVGFDQSKWFKISIQVMAIATYYKYSLNRDLRLQLFETCGAEIIEVNPTDKRWGIGLPMDDWRICDKNEWKGTNILGRMITMCRDKLLENPKFSYDKDLMLKEIKEAMDAARSVGCLVENEFKEN
ncbi:hypothetical protein ACQ4LE_006569 [Meloidogyne hapla]